MEEGLVVPTLYSEIDEAEEIPTIDDEIYLALTKHDQPNFSNEKPRQFSSSQWLTHFAAYTNPDWIKANSQCKTFVHHNMRLIIQKQTLLAFDNYRYRLENGHVIQLNKEFILENVNKTHYYKEAPEIPYEFVEETEIQVIEGDCLETAHYLQTQGFSTACLNMANAHSPGGGYKSGQGAQEENLHRRTGLFQCLHDPKKIQGKKGGSNNYPISEEGVIYSPDVVVIRASEPNGYRFLSQPYLMSILSCPAISHPILVGEKMDRMNSNAVGTMKSKIKTLLAVGKLHGHDALVLSALGCGAFRCPPAHVAELFKEALENEFKGAFKRIVFAIYNDHNAFGEGNVKPFADVFAVKSILLSDLLP